VVGRGLLDDTPAVGCGTAGLLRGGIVIGVRLLPSAGVASTPSVRSLSAIHMPTTARTTPAATTS